MSYILDALKKSSEERRKRQQEEELQGPLLLDQAVNRKAPGNKRLLPILSALALAVFLVLSWQFFSLHDESPPARSNLEQVPPASPGQEPEETAAENQRIESSGLQVQPAGKPSAAAEKGVEATGNSAAENSDLKTDPGPALLEELPLAIRAQLPEMKYSGHVFSPNPDLRMILINTTVVREGDLIDDETRLLEITSEGLVMSYKGTHFKVVLF